MIRADKLNPLELPEEELDSPLGAYTGAGAIFGATGGVMEAALRTAAYLVNGENPDPDAFAAVRTGPGLREAEYELGGSKIRCAVVSGLGNARKLIQDLKAGPGQIRLCGGHGPAPAAAWAAEASRCPWRTRSSTACGESGCMTSTAPASCASPTRIRRSSSCTGSFWASPLSHRSEELLHTDHRAWDMPK